jgi:ABC-type transport system involved in multi-copper enzyme maturation permease subunit
MLAVIIKREILEYIKSAKFMIGLGITVTLLVISTLINIQDYTIRQQDYLDAQRELTKDTFYVRVLRPPQMLSILAQGKDRKLGNSLTMTYLNLPYRTSGYLGQYTSKHQQYAAGFAAVDFVFVVRVVLSLMVIFLAYNAISEEKTQGTLKQVLANALPRDQILLGKFAGGLIVVLGSLLISTVFTVLIMLFHPAVSIAGTDWPRILSILGVSALYLICFYTLSLFVSVAVNRPATALMILLQIWIFLIIILPNLGVIAADNLDPLPSEQEIAQQKTAAFLPYAEEFKKVRDAFTQAVRSAQAVPEEIGKRNIELWTMQTDMNFQVDSEFSRKLTAQMNFAQNFSFLSPAVLLDQAVNRYAKTGMNEFEKFMEGVYRHWQKLAERMKLRYEDIKAYKEANLPEFSYLSEPMSESFVSTLPQWILLFVFGVIFFTLAYVKFLKKDVR